MTNISSWGPTANNTPTGWQPPDRGAGAPRSQAPRPPTPPTTAWALALSIVALVIPVFAMGLVGMVMAMISDPSDPLSDETLNNVFVPLMGLVWLSWPITAVTALVLSLIARRRIKAAPAGTVGGSSQATSALVMSTLAVCFFILWLLPSILFGLLPDA